MCVRTIITTIRTSNLTHTVLWELRFSRYCVPNEPTTPIFKGQDWRSRLIQHISAYLLSYTGWHPIGPWCLDFSPQWNCRNSPQRHAAYCDADDGLTYDGKGSRILYWLYADLNPSLLTLSQLIYSSGEHIRFCCHFHSGIFTLLVEFLDLNPQLDLASQLTPSGGEHRHRECNKLIWRKTQTLWM
jgi:hypothetical protein